MYANKKLPELGGESGIRTAFFSDLQSFSTISEQLTSKELVDLLNEFLSSQTEIILNNKGTLDKYEGDAILSFFGAPLFLKLMQKLQLILVFHVKIIWSNYVKNGLQRVINGQKLFIQ